MVPEDLRYHTEHEWVRLDGRRATIGISDFAQDALGDVVFVELPNVKAELSVNQEMGEVESTKATSSLHAPVSGTVLEVNTALRDHPEYLNQDPYGKGWIAMMELADPADVEALMTASQYEALLASQR